MSWPVSPVPWNKRSVPRVMGQVVCFPVMRRFEGPKGELLRENCRTNKFIPDGLDGRPSVRKYPEAYKDVSMVVDVVQRAGLARKVARIHPMGVVKG